MNPWESPALRKTAEARTPSSSSLEKLLPEKRKCLFISLLRIERSHSIEKRYLTSHVVQVDNLNARLHLGYAKHAIVHAKAASLRARLVFINFSNLQKRTESGLEKQRAFQLGLFTFTWPRSKMERSKKAD